MGGYPSSVLSVLLHPELEETTTVISSPHKTPRLQRLSIALGTAGLLALETLLHAQPASMPQLPTAGAHLTNGTINILVGGMNVGYDYAMLTRPSIGGDVQCWSPLDNGGLPASAITFYPQGYVFSDTIGFSADNTNDVFVAPWSPTNNAFFWPISMDDYVNNIYYYGQGTKPQIFSPQDGDTVTGKKQFSTGMWDIFEPYDLIIWVGNDDNSAFSHYAGRSVWDGSSGNITVDMGSFPSGSRSFGVEYDMVMPPQTIYGLPTSYAAYSDLVTVNIANPDPSLVSQQQAGTSIFLITLTNLIHSSGDFIPGHGYAYPGHQYIIADESDLGNTNSTIKQFVPIPLAGTGITNDYDMGKYAFTPTNSAQTISIVAPTNSSARLGIFDYTTYPGPVPVFVNVQDSDVAAAGIAHVQIAATNLWPTTKQEILIDGVLAASSTNGGFDIPTYLYPNAVHTLDARLTTSLPAMNEDSTTVVADIPADTVINWSTANSLAVNFAPDNFTAEFGTLPLAFDTANPAIVNVNIYDQSSNLVWSASTTNLTSGTCYPSWGLVDNDGNPVPLPDGDHASVGYVIKVFSLGLSANLSSSNATTLTLPLNISANPRAGDTAAFRNQHIPSQEGSYWALGAKEDRVIELIAGAVSLAHTVYPQDPWGGDRDMDPTLLGPTGVQGEKMMGQNDNAWSILHTLTNGTPYVNQFVYEGHGRKESIGPDPSTDLGDWLLLDWQLGDTLQTYQRGSYINGAWHWAYGRRVRMADFASCYVGSGDFHNYCGSPDDESGMGQSASVGWTSLAWGYGSKLYTTSYEVVEENWWGYWANQGFSAGPGVKRSNQNALDDAYSNWMLGRFPATYTPLLLAYYRYFIPCRLNGIHGAQDMRWQMLQ